MLVIDSSRYSRASTAIVNENQQRELRSSGVPVILPTYIPSGFRAVEVKTMSDGAKGYSIVFERADDNRCFLVEGIDGGIGGGIDLEFTLPIDSKLFGSGYILSYGLPKDPEMKQQFPETDLYSDWMERNRFFYRLGGALIAREEYDYANCRQDLEPSEAVKVIESFSENR
jgi:hypothetical protein